MRLPIPVFPLIVMVYLSGNPLHAHDPDNGRLLSLENGVTMELLEEDGQFIGIGEIRSGEQVLHTGSQPVFPLVAADWSWPDGLYADLRLAEVRERESGWELVLELRELEEAEAWTSFFLVDEEAGILRDTFFFPRTALRNSREMEGYPSRGRVNNDRLAASPPAGYLLWRIEPVTEVIAGWKWHGWRWSFSGKLGNGAAVNAFRLLSAWALDGNMDGLTLVNQRYRGLGYPAQTFTDAGEGVARCWNTQDVRPPDPWKGRSARRWMPLAYQLMAFNAWLAPETWLYEVTRETHPDTVIAEFGRLANEFLAARPDMVRPYILPDDKGLIHLQETTCVNPPSYGHDPHEGGVGDIDESVSQHHGRIGDVGIDQFSGRVEIRPDKHEKPDEAIRYGTHKEVDPEFSPACYGAVRNRSHDGIRDGIDNPRDQEHGTDGRRRQADDIGVVKQEEDSERLEKKVGGGIPEGISGFLHPAELICLHGWVPISCQQDLTDKDDIAAGANPQGKLRQEIARLARSCSGAWKLKG